MYLENLLESKKLQLRRKNDIQFVDNSAPIAELSFSIILSVKPIWKSAVK